MGVALKDVFAVCFSLSQTKNVPHITCFMPSAKMTPSANFFFFFSNKVFLKNKVHQKKKKKKNDPKRRGLPWVLQKILAARCSEMMVSRINLEKAAFKLLLGRGAISSTSLLMRRSKLQGCSSICPKTHFPCPIWIVAHSIVLRNLHQISEIAYRKELHFW